MARIFIDGFESGDAQLWDEFSPGTISTNGISGGYSAKPSELDILKLIKNIPAAGTYYFALTLKPNGLFCKAICTLALNDVPIVTITRKNNNVGQLELRDGDDAGDILQTGPITRGTPDARISWIVVHIEAGVVRVEVNGREAINHQLQDWNEPLQQFDNRTTQNIDQFVVGSYSGLNKSTGSIDDIVIDNSERPTKPRIIGLKPSADGDTTAWAASSGGAHYLDIDDPVSDDGETFVMANTGELVDLYNIDSLNPLFTNIRCIQVGANAWYEGNAAVTKLALMIKTNGTEYTGATQQLIQYPRGFVELWENNPSDALPFEFADIANLQIGVKSKV